MKRGLPNRKVCTIFPQQSSEAAVDYQRKEESCMSKKKTRKDDVKEFPNYVFEEGSLKGQNVKD